MLLRPLGDNLSVRTEFLFPILMPPAVPGIEEIGNGSLLPSKFSVSSGHDEERFAPGEHALESFSEPTDSSFLCPLGSKIDLSNSNTVLLLKRSIVDSQQTGAAQQGVR